MSAEYNLSNPSIAEEERMIQDRIDAEYDALEADNKAMEKQMEEDYYKQMEEEI